MLYCLALDNPDPGFDSCFESSAFADAGGDIERITKQLGIANVFSLFSYAAQNALFPEGYEETEILWLDPQQGIEWLDAVIRYVRDRPSEVQSPVQLLQDLENCRGILDQAKHVGAKWHFEMDL